MTLIEKLTVAAIVSILASMLLVAVGKAAMSIKLWMWGAQAMNENRINAACDGNDRSLELLVNQKTQKWTIVP